MTINVKDISKEVVEVNSLENLVAAYEEIASIRMRNTRESVIKNRMFLSELKLIFEQVRLSYAKEVMELAQKRGKKKANITFLPHNGKTVSVLVSANTGLYGDIVRKTYDMFMSEVAENKSEITIIGKHGLSLFISETTNKPYTYFDFPDYGIDQNKLSEIIRHIVQYEEIHMYYGKFKNIISQEAVTLAVSAEIPMSKEKVEKIVAYIFEPTLEKILMFFETEIFTSLFDQAIRESQLAKFASRFVAMDAARERISDRVKKLDFERLRMLHIEQNKKQLNSLNSTYLWLATNR